MLVIVEGPDKAGKTTLVAALAAALRVSSGAAAVDVLHRGPPVAHPLLEYEAPLDGYRPGTGEHVVCDRWHVGEVVYPLVTGRPTRQDATVLRHINMFLRSRGALLVLVSPPAEVLTRRLREDGDDRVRDEAELLRARDEFAVAVVNLVPALPYVQVDRVTHETVPALLAVARSLEREVARLAGFRTYVGVPRPDHLLVGDVRGTPGTDRTALPYPAFGPYQATSGYYLLSTLSDHVVDHAGLTNACDVDDVVALYETLGRPPTVALGRRADRRLTQLGVEHGAVPHPQFVKRFLHRHREAYGDIITHALRTGEDLSTWRP